MKILYIGHVREQSGWGNATRDWIRCLLAAGVDLTVRSIDFDPKVHLEPEIVDCMRKKDTGYDAVIQNIIPTHMEYHAKAGKNIGLFFLDSFNIEYTPWSQKLALMDEVWTTNTQALKEVSKYKQNCHLIFPAVDLHKYTYARQQMFIPQTEGNKKLYFIGELNPRKNIGSLIKAYYLTFHKNDPVSLILKLNSSLGPERTGQVVYEDIQKICSDMKLYPSFEDYPSINIISDEMTDDDILNLHYSCDCLVMPSYNEGFCIPAFDALSIGNQVIGTDVGGLREFSYYGLQDLTLVSGTFEPVEKMRNLFSNVFTSRESWKQINIEELSNAMWSWYQNPMPKSPKTLEDYSYENVASSMIDRILS